MFVWLGWALFVLHWRPFTVPHLVWDSFAACPAMIFSSLAVLVFPGRLRITDLDRCSGAAAELAVAEMMRRTGWRNVQVIGGAGDGGVDILAVSPRGRRMAVQVKRTLRPVGPGVIRDLSGAMRQQRYRGRVPMLVTIARVTQAASTAAACHHIGVAGRAEVIRWLERARVRR